MKNAWRTAVAQVSSMVKRVRSKSHEQPMPSSWLRMVASYSSFHSCTLATKSSRAKSVRFLPCSSRRFSTTVWVAMPAWSVPGIHSVLKPRMRW